jgi:amidohydrolase
VLSGGKAGPVVAYRADMDAIHSTAPDPVPFASETPGVRHICGHDVHSTVAIGIAEALAEIRDELPGTVKFIFQPSEENAEGAKAMINDGVMKEPAPDAIFAVHCAPLEIGQMGSCEGMLLPGLDVVSVILSGQGDLAATAKECIKVILGVNSTEASSAEEDLTGGLSNEGRESREFIASWVYQSEEQVDGEWIVMGMVRASSEEQHARAKEAIEKGLGVIDRPGVSYELDYTVRAIPPVMNDPELTLRANEVFREVISEDAVFLIDEPNPNFSEDFAHFQDWIPGAMFFLGVSNEAEGIMGLPHHPMFAVDEEAIVLGAKAMTLVIVDYLKTH